MGRDWRLSRLTLARWVAGALSGWIGHRWAGGKRSRDFVNNRMRRLRAPSTTHSWVHSRLITKANEWRTRGEEAYKKKAKPLPHYPTGHLSSIAPLNEPRPRVNMPLGCQSILVTCNTNTQNLLSYKINVLLVLPCIALAQSYWSALKSSTAPVWQIMAKWSDSLAFSTYQVCRLCYFEAIAWYLSSKHSKCWITGESSKIALIRCKKKHILEQQRIKHEHWICDIRSKLYSVHFKPWMFSLFFFYFFFYLARLKLYLFCIQESKKNNCTTPQGWQRKSFSRPLCPPFLPGAGPVCDLEVSIIPSLVHW